jgi:hypothetical protein
MAKIKTLVDSGATENLVDQKTAKELGMTLQELPSACNITNIDGTGNPNRPITLLWIANLPEQERGHPNILHHQLGK